MINCIIDLGLIKEKDTYKLGKLQEREKKFKTGQL